jgi:hypothetical protein
MQEKLNIERDFSAIEEFIQVSILSGKTERMRKVCQNITKGNN